MVRMQDKTLEISIRGKPVKIKLKLEVVKILGCAGVEKRNKIYGNKVIEVGQKQFLLENEKEVAMISLWQESCDGQIPAPIPERHLMSTTYVVPVRSCAQSKTMHSSARNVFWSKIEDRWGNSFVGMLPIYTDKTVSTLKTNTIVAYPVHVVFLCYTNRYHRYLIDWGHILVGLFLVSTLTDTSVEEDAYESVSDGKLSKRYLDPFAIQFL